MPGAVFCNRDTGKIKKDERVIRPQQKRGRVVDSALWRSHAALARSALPLLGLTILELLSDRCLNNQKRERRSQIAPGRALGADPDDVVCAPSCRIRGDKVRRE